MLRSPICETLGIEKPIFQGGMAWIADASLASAVSEAGGLGIIAAMNANAAWLRSEIQALRAKTSKPFGVNVMLMSPFADEVAQVVIEEHVPVVVTGAGNPVKYMKAWNEAGIKVIPGRRLRRARPHRRARRRRRRDRRGRRERRARGRRHHHGARPAGRRCREHPRHRRGRHRRRPRHGGRASCSARCGVQVGTRFLVAEECTVSEEYKERVLKAKDISTLVTGRRTGHAVRCLKTPFTNAFAQARERGRTRSRSSSRWAPAPSARPRRTATTRRARSCAGRSPASSASARAPAQIVEDIVGGAEALLKGAGRMGGVAFLFAGQGAQHPGMGAALAEREARGASAVFAAADALRPGTSDAVLQPAPPDELDQTADDAAVRLRLRPRLRAGRSRRTGVTPACRRRLLPRRGRRPHLRGRPRATRPGFELVCHRAAVHGRSGEAEHPGAMRAVLKLDAAKRSSALAREAGDAWPVNYNSPQQTVVAGARPRRSRRTRRARDAPPAGAACPSRSPAPSTAPTWRQRPRANSHAYLADGHGRLAAPRIPVIANRTAAPYPERLRWGEPAGAARAELARERRRRSPVRVGAHLTRSARTSRGIDTFVEVGPGKDPHRPREAHARAAATALPCETPEAARCRARRARRRPRSTARRN